MSAGDKAVRANWLTDSLLAERLATGRLSVPGSYWTTDRAPMSSYLAYDGDRKWMQWTDDRVWSPIPEAKAVDLVREELKAIYHAVAAETEDASAAKLLVPLLTAKKARDVLFFLRGLLAVPEEQWDADPDVLNCLNGLVDLRTGDIRQPLPSDYLSKLAGAVYNPNATHPEWDKALEAVPDDVREWLQVRWGQGLTGWRTDDDTMIVTDSPGGSGKSTIADACRYAAGDYAVTVSHKVLMANQGEHTTESYTLKGARLAVLEELPEGGRVNDHQLKNLAGSDTMHARRMRQDDDEFKVTHSLVINTNHRPVVTNADHATWRRIILVPFPYKFKHPSEPLMAPHERHGVPGLRERIIANSDDQLEAVLAWMIEGARAWYELDRDLKAWPWPDSVKDATEEWKREADPILSYLQDRITFDPNGMVLASELYEDFVEHLRKSGKAVWSAETFAARFKVHETVGANSVTKARVNAPTGVSRSLPSNYSLPITGKPNLWKGVRFN